MPRTDQNARIRNCIEHMLKYCDQIQETLDAIQNNKEAFLASHIYQNAVAMCILQLGELTKQLTPEFTAAHRQIPWSLIAKSVIYTCLFTVWRLFAIVLIRTGPLCVFGNIIFSLC